MTDHNTNERQKWLYEMGRKSCECGIYQGCDVCGKYRKRQAGINPIPDPKPVMPDLRGGNSIWWWAIAIVALVLLFMLVSRVGPVVFPAG